MIHEDTPHQLGRHREKMRPIFPADILAAGQADVSLMNQRCALESVSRALACQEVPRHPSEFVIDEGNKSVSGRGIAAAPATKQFSHLVVG